EYLLLLNPDTVVLDRAVDRLVDFAERTPSALIWGGRTLFADGSLNPASCWRRMSAWSALCRAAGLDTARPSSPLFNREGYGGWDRNDERDVDIVSGCFFLTTRSFWEEMGGFDLTYEMYGEEADLCLRGRSRGVQPRVSPRATIVHYGGASETVKGDKHVRLIRAKITLALRHQRGAGRVLSVWLLRLWPLSRWVMAAALRRIRPGSEIDRVRSDWRYVWSQRALWWNGYAADRNERAASRDR
ncbi:MAG: glycosyltransferase family 2 protein, partial [Actinomycetota bacterium]